MVKAVKKDSGSVYYMRIKKHVCPNCSAQLKIVKMKKTVKANTEEAAKFNFTAAGHPLGEKVKFIWYEFKCPECEAHFTEDALRKIEKQAKKDAAKAKKEEKRAARKAEKQAKKDAAKKE